MKNVNKIQQLVVILLFCSFGFNGLTFAKVSNITPPYNTRVETYQAAVPGPMGEIGPQGKDGLSIVGPAGATTYNQVPILIQGQKADPCTTKQDEQGVTVSCPDGSKSFIPAPTNGQDGSNGREIDIRKNLTTGNVETKYSDDLGWKVLLTKCDYDPGACNGS